MIADHAFATGHIERATFERVLSPTRMKVGIDNGLGCFPDKMPADRRPIDWAPDEFDHEISTCVNVKGRGLVVTTSCGHRGVVNSVKRAMDVSSVRKVHAARALPARRTSRLPLLLRTHSGQNQPSPSRPPPTSRRLKGKKLSCGSASQGPARYTRRRAHDASRSSRPATLPTTSMSSRW